MELKTGPPQSQQVRSSGVRGRSSLDMVLEQCALAVVLIDFALAEVLISLAHQRFSCAQQDDTTYQLSASCAHEYYESEY